MKKFILRALLGLVIFFLNSKLCYAQLFEFNPAQVTYIGAAGTDSIVTFWTEFYWNLGSIDTLSGVTLGCTPGIKTDPSYVSFVFSPEGGVDVKVTVDIDSIMDSTSNCSSDIIPPQVYTPYAAWFIHAYRYDPKIKGRVRLMNDTVNFGEVPIGTTTYQSGGVSIDTEGSIFRSLSPLNVIVPFAWGDSIAPEYFGDCPDPLIYTNYNPSFEPTEVKTYIDSVYIYDPIQNDSTMLILIGDGVAAGVAESTTDEPTMQVYPNPCDRFANIVLPDDGLEQIEIRNALGAVVQSYRYVGSDLMLDASSLPGGIYFIEARANGTIFTKKLVVIH